VAALQVAMVQLEGPAMAKVLGLAQMLGQEPQMGRQEDPTSALVQRMLVPTTALELGAPGQTLAQPSWRAQAVRW